MRRLLFVATIAANAALLFAVEPMVSKRVLPLFGGAPSVWNTCLMAFQALLLVGYLYAHVLARRLAPRTQVVVHLALLGASLAALPPIVRHAAPPGGWAPATWLLVVLLGAIGAPFVILSAGAPLLQRWYAAAAPSGEPYFLYAASNAGSMLALLGYPLLVEPRLGLVAQGSAWSLAYGAVGVALGACGLATWRAPATPRPSIVAGGSAPAWRTRLAWLALAFVPSSLLLGVTRYLTTDVAPVPLLWVIPLALYLLTFVVAFAERARVPTDVLDVVFAGALPVLALLTTLGVNKPLWAIAAVHVAVVAVASLVCHQALADRRPAPARLTEYYLWVSLGGLAGGAFNALVAPAAFDTLAEYPLAMGLAALAWAWSGARESSDPVSTPAARPAHFAALPELQDDAPMTRGAWLAYHVGAPLLTGALMFGAIAVRDVVPSALRATASVALGVPAAMLCFVLRRRRVPCALAMCALLVGSTIGARANDGEVLLRARSFFGAYAVRSVDGYHVLQNGTTMHGAQDPRPAGRTTPLTYYHREGPLGALFAHVPALASTARPRRVAVVGLGTGTVACYGRAGERWTFYEIDPLIVRIARDARLFTYLRDCPPTVDVVVGDARLRLAEAADASYDLIVLDAFSSDAIPAHLLTREALALYVRKLAPDGVVAIHVSNRYLDLRPVVAELARDARMAGSVGEDVSGAVRRRALVSTSVWVAVARRAATLGALTRQPGWAPLSPGGILRPWSDDFTDVLTVVKWR